MTVQDSLASAKRNDESLAIFLPGFPAEDEMLKPSLACSLWESHVFGQILRQISFHGESMGINWPNESNIQTLRWDMGFEPGRAA